jgi:hypothetical protein
MKRFLLCVFVFFSGLLSAQTTVNCPSHIIYLQNTPITKYDPNLPLSATNPSSIGVTNIGSGLALCNNLNGGSLSPTFYTSSGGNYYYWNGTSWVNTGHSTGHTSAVNMSGAGCYIYNLVGSTGDVYKYDGTGPGTLLVNVPGFSGGGPFDISSDFDGNFYVLRTQSPSQWLKMYDFTGSLLITFSVTGMPSVVAGGGFAVMGNTVYAQNTSGFFTGVMSGSNINFSLTSTSPSLAAADYANCPTVNTAFTNYTVTNNGPYSCVNNTVTVSAVGFPASTTYSWSGPGLIGSTTNSSVPTNSPGLYNCTITPSSGCKTVLSTSVTTGPNIISVAPTTTFVCLGSSVNLTASGAANYTWSPPAGLSSTSGSMVSASPTVATNYTVTGSTGTCVSSPSTAYITVVVCSSVNELSESLYGLTVFPNPSNGEFTLRSKAEISMSLVNELGQEVKSIELNPGNNFEFKLSDVSQGIYFLSDLKGRALRDKIVVIKN